MTQVVVAKVIAAVVVAATAAAVVVAGTAVQRHVKTETIPSQIRLLPTVTAFLLLMLPYAPYLTVSFARRWCCRSSLYRELGRVSAL